MTPQTSASERAAIQKSPLFKHWCGECVWMDKQDRGHVSLPLILMTCGLPVNEKNLRAARWMARPALWFVSVRNRIFKNKSRAPR